MSDHRLSDDEQQAYTAGVTARTDGHTRAACPHLHLSRLGSFWLGGWHDTDIARTQVPVAVKRKRKIEIRDGVRL